MDDPLLLQTLLIFIIATFLLRIGGRKSIAQMTIPQAVVIVSIGTLLIQPVTGNGLWMTFLVAAVLIFCLMITEYIALKSNKFESIVSGKAVPVIVNGQLNEKNLHKLRLTVDKLEAQVREYGIASLRDIQHATLEMNGKIGYTLKPEKQPATKEDIENLIRLIQTGQRNEPSHSKTDESLFTETIESPKKLQ